LGSFQGTFSMVVLHRLKDLILKFSLMAGQVKTSARSLLGIPEHRQSTI
jgi:hypothetical protein